MMPHNHLCMSKERNINFNNIYQKHQLKDTVFTVGRVSKKQSATGFTLHFGPSIQDKTV